MGQSTKPVCLALPMVSSEALSDTRIIFVFLMMAQHFICFLNLTKITEAILSAFVYRLLQKDFPREIFTKQSVDKYR